MFKKIKPARNKKYMKWVSLQPCCLTGLVANDHQSVDPHHEPLKGHGTMGGKPCDSRCVPVAHYVHSEMESGNSSRVKVWETYGKDPEQEIKATRDRWLKSGGQKFWEE